MSKKYKSESWLREKYQDERLNLREIGDLCECTGETIRRWMDEFNIERRDRSESVKTQWEGNSERRQAQAQRRDEWQGSQYHLKHGEHKDETLEKMSQVKIGEDNPNWSGGYDGNYTAHTGWRRIREKVIQRDRVCWGCGLPYRLQVHHVTPVREFEDPADAHTMDNLITVCQWCHPGFECRHTMVKV